MRNGDKWLRNYMVPMSYMMLFIGLSFSAVVRAQQGEGSEALSLPSLYAVELDKYCVARGIGLPSEIERYLNAISIFAKWRLSKNGLDEGQQRGLTELLRTIQHRDFSERVNRALAPLLIGAGEKRAVQACLDLPLYVEARIDILEKYVKQNPNEVP